MSVAEVSAHVKIFGDLSSLANKYVQVGNRSDIPFYPCIIHDAAHIGILTMDKIKKFDHL